MKCLIKGCQNEKERGGGIDCDIMGDPGWICLPCYHMLISGHIGPGATFIHQLVTNMAMLTSAMVKQLLGVTTP